jgi:uncharacterized protein YjiS (DUF1127 family)
MRTARGALTPFPGSAAWSALRRRVASFFECLAAEARARRTRRELEGLSDHILRDIGLRRDQIALVSRNRCSR